MVYDFEARELSGAIMLNSMARMADALGCRVVYGIVPKYGQTLDGLAGERLWKEVMEGREQKSGEQGIGNRDQRNEETENRREPPTVVSRLVSIHRQSRWLYGCWPLKGA